MKKFRVRVRPLPEGWIVDPEGAVEPLIFRSGGRAEAQAHDLARTLAAAGAPAEVLIHDRSYEVVGSTTYPPSSDPDV